MILGLEFTAAIIAAILLERAISSKGAGSLIGKFFLFLATSVIVVLSFTVPDAPMFQAPQLARVFFYHFPSPILSTWFIFGGCYLGYRYLRTGDRRWDMRAVAANELGLVFGLLGMAAGILFSKVQWGEWWQWDPRQTSFMLVLLIYMAYFVLRAGYADENKRASFAAAYSLAAALPNVFLIFIFPRLPQVASQSFHPTQTVQGGLLDADYGRVVASMFFVFFTLGFWLYRLRVRASLLDLKLEDMRAELADRDGSAPTGVVRPVSLPNED